MESVAYSFYYYKESGSIPKRIRITGKFAEDINEALKSKGNVRSGTIFTTAKGNTYRVLLSRRYEGVKEVLFSKLI
jgi:hypothetical protein